MGRAEKDPAPEGREEHRSPSRPGEVPPSGSVSHTQKPYSGSLAWLERSAEDSEDAASGLSSDWYLEQKPPHW